MGADPWLWGGQNWEARARARCRPSVGPGVFVSASRSQSGESPRLSFGRSGLESQLRPVPALWPCSLSLAFCKMGLLDPCLIRVLVIIIVTIPTFLKPQVTRDFWP